MHPRYLGYVLTSFSTSCSSVRSLYCGYFPLMRRASSALVNFSLFLTIPSIRGVTSAPTGTPAAGSIEMYVGGQVAQVAHATMMVHKTMRNIASRVQPVSRIAWGLLVG